MRGGERLPAGRVELEEARARAREEIARLPARLRALEPADPPYPAGLSPSLERYAREMAGVATESAR